MATNDGGQAQGGQAAPLSEARLARALTMVRLFTTPGVMAPEAADAIQDVLAEVERLRAEAILLQAQADGAASLLLDVQQDCIALRKREAALVEMVRQVAAFDTTRDSVGAFWRMQKQARALLASAEGEGAAAPGESEASNA